MAREQWWRPGPEEPLLDLSDMEPEVPKRPVENRVNMDLPMRLLEFLTSVQRGPLGQKTPTMTLWLDDHAHRWYGVLHDRSHGATLFRSAESVEELLAVLASALNHVPAGWKPDRERSTRENSR